MRRFSIICSLLLFTFWFDKCFSKSLSGIEPTGAMGKSNSEVTFLLFSLLVLAVYTIYTGSKYSHEETETSLRRRAPVDALARKLAKVLGKMFRPFEKTAFGAYIKSIYAEPVRSEQALGKFFFGKTLLTTSLAFYDTPVAVLVGILVFSAVFDSLTGFYQQTLMNFFHKSAFESKVARFCQNLVKRYLVDVFRAEVIFLILMGLDSFAFSEQFHIFRNRFVSASYYFNAVIIDSLVAQGVITRKLRARFVIFASTIGGMLCLLDFAKTKFPSWVSPEMVGHIPQWAPGPLGMLMYFNILIFLLFGGVYVMNEYRKWEGGVSAPSPAFE